MKMTKKLLSILLSVVMILGVCAVAPVTVSAEDSVYEIDSYAKLKEFASLVNGGQNGLNAKLTADIDASASASANDWTPIGKNDYYDCAYFGTFDGQCHTIIGLTYNNSEQGYAGLFGCVNDGGKVMNVGLEGGSITGNGSAGGVVGLNVGGTITNCYNTGAVSGNTLVGGIVGQNVSVGDSWIRNSLVINCHNTGSVSGERDIGGVVGRNTGTVTNCYNTGDVTATGYYGSASAGGIVGYNSNYDTFYSLTDAGVITDCYNTGKVTATAEAPDETFNSYAYAGGIAALNNSDFLGTRFENCYNKGDVYAALKAEGEGSSTGRIYAGGIIGENSDNDITNCYNTGNVTAESIGFRFEIYTGGLAGSNSSSVSNSYNTGNVTVKGEYVDSLTYTGGLIGTNGNAIKNCYNTGDVSVTAVKNSSEYNWNAWIRTGGVVGNNYSEITDCYNTGNVTVTATGDIDDLSSYYSGVAGYNSHFYDGEYGETAILTNCYYDSNRCTAESAIGENSATATNVTGLPTKNMTGSSALENMAFDTTDGNPWLVKENETYCVYYPHLKGYNLDDEGQQLTADEITFTNWPPKYAEFPLWVGGEQVTSKNMDDLSVIEGVSVAEDGYAKFEVKDGKNILSLRNATITGTQTYYYGEGCTTNILVEGLEFDLTINLEGENTLGDAADSGIKMSEGNSDLTLTGGGKLSVTANNSCLETYDNLLIDNADISATAKGNEIGNGDGIYAWDIEIKNSTVYAEGAGNGTGIYCYGALSITDSRVEVKSTDTDATGIFLNGRDLTVSGDSVVIVEGGTEDGAIFRFGEIKLNDGNEIIEPANCKIQPHKTLYWINVVYAINDDETETLAQKVVIAQPQTISVTANPTNGGTVTGVEKTYKGATVKVTAEPYEYYNFVNWTENGTVVSTDAEYSFTVTEGRNLTANFAPDSFTITYYIGDDVFKTDTLPFGSNVTAPEVDEKAGYTFAWVDEIPGTMPAENVTINGKYTAITYTATFVDENGKTVGTRDYTVETTKLDEPAVPEKAGYDGRWEEYTLKIGGVTVKPVYDNITLIAIKDYEENSETGYKEDKTFTAEADNLPEGAEIHWFVNGEDVGTGESYTVEDPTDDYTVQAKLIGKDGTVLAESETQKVTVKNGFFDRLKAFFAELIEKILGKALADLLSSVC